MMLNEHYLTIFFGLATLASLTAALVQYKNAAKVKKILDDYTKGLLRDAKHLLDLVREKGSTKKEFETQVVTLREKLITLDIVNRNLTAEKIEEMEKEEQITKEEAEKYKKLTSE